MKKTKSEILRELRTTHGETGSVLYKRYRSILDRCYDKTSKAYEFYGARGIKMCDEWRKDYAIFSRYMKANFPNYRIEFAAGKQVDRIDNMKNYEPGNLRLVTRKENCANRRSTIFVDFEGQHLCAKEFWRLYCQHLGYECVLLRLRMGMSAEEVISKPKNNNKSGIIGVSWASKNLKWRATRKGKHLGYFDSKEEAAKAYEGSN